MISTQHLLRGKPIRIDGIGTLVSPTLDSIFDLSGDTDSQDKYLIYLNILRMNLQSFLKMSGLEHIYNEMSDEQKQQCSLYKLLIAEKQMRSILIECFSFFIAENIEFNQENLCFDVLSDENETVGVINEENFNSVRFNILRMNCISAQEMKPLKFKNEHARQIYEACQQGREEFEKAKQTNKVDVKFSFENLVTYVATKSQTYNFENVWNLTIYQFQQEFQRLNLYNQLDTISKRWATWGKDKFDFSAWYENIEILK